MTPAHRFAPFLLVLAALLLPADDGMWMPHQMKDLDLSKLGMQMDPARLYAADGSGLMSAVVSLGGGTGEFVSDSGLILTNHHVAFFSLQQASDKEHDYIRDGFLAPERGQEIPAPGAIADVLLGYDDVTRAMTAVLKPGMTASQRAGALDRQAKKLAAAAEAQGPDLSCQVRAMYSGNRYYLFRAKRIKDIRLVYAPPQSIGNFGGETDNWMWPRHTCDFTFLRAYVSPEGVGAPYAARNVPYRPRVHLKVSLDGVRAGDFTFIMGYPGRTFRNQTVAETRSALDDLAEQVAQSKELIAFFEKAGQDDRAIQIKYAARLKGLYNRLKNIEGKLDGFARFAVLDKMATQETAFRAWIRETPERDRQLGDVVGGVEQALQEARAFRDRQEAVNSFAGAYASTLFGQALTLARAAYERQKPDLIRDPLFQDKNLPFTKQRIALAERGYDLATDRAFFAFAVQRLVQKYPGALPKALQRAIGNGSAPALAALTATMYDRTCLASPEKRTALLGLPPARLRKVGDPLLDLALDLEKERKELRAEGEGIGQQLAERKARVEAALLAWRNGKLAPDANGTIRFTCGGVEGYSPRDAVTFLPQTTLAGVIAKDTGKEPFDVPRKLKDLHAARDFGPYRDARLDDVATCFLNTTNVTGGNSGSPILNARGEQVGIVFDMTYESVIGDYFIVPELQRSIGVDIRYVLFVTDKFAGATGLLAEIGL